jgi:hypothetical protein
MPRHGMRPFTPTWCVPAQNIFGRCEVSSTRTTAQKRWASNNAPPPRSATEKMIHAWCGLDKALRRHRPAMELTGS